MLRSSVFLRLGGLIVGILALGGCTGAPMGGGNGGGNLPADAEPIQDIGGFFAVDRAWAVVAGSVFVSGFGTHVEFVSISTGPGEPVCLGIEPANARVAFDGQKFQVLTRYEGTDFGDSCRLQITGDAAACAPDQFGSADSPCDIANAVADITIDGESVEVDAPQIVRFSRCDPVLLSSRDEWLVTSTNPLAMILLQDPASVGALFAAGGAGADFLTANLLTGLDGQTALGCFDETVEGETLDFDLETLSIDVGMNDDGDCTVTFEGDVEYCALINSADLGGAIGQSTALVRVEGTGDYEHAEGEGSFAVMYISYASGPAGGGGCGEVRCKERLWPGHLFQAPSERVPGTR